MHLKHLALGLAVVTAAPVAVTTAQADDGIFVPLFTYRTGPFSGSGIPVANGLHDYFTMLNERDGGIGGERLIVQECEDGYDTQKGVQCYDSVKDRNPVVITPYSTGITEQLIPKAAVDKIPILSMAYGLSASADGNRFPWIFNPPDTYWDGASAFIRHAADVEGGVDKLKGKTIGLVYLDAPYGKEPIPLLQALAKDYGYTLKLYPVEADAMQDQDSLWLDVRRDRPDWLYLQGWGAMNPTAVQEAAKNGFNMDHLVGCGGRAAIRMHVRQAPAARATRRSTSTQSERIFRRFGTSSNTWSTSARAGCPGAKSARTSINRAVITPCSSPKEFARAEIDRHEAHLRRRHGPGACSGQRH